MGMLASNTILVVRAESRDGKSSIQEVIPFESKEEARDFLGTYGGYREVVYLWTGSKFLNSDLEEVDLRIILDPVEGAKVVLPHTWSEGFLTGEEARGEFGRSFIGSNEDTWDFFRDLEKELEDRRN